MCLRKITLLSWCHRFRKEGLFWTPEGKRQRGRPRTTWRRSTEKELETIHLTWGEIRKAAQDHLHWRETVKTLCVRWRKTFWKGALRKWLWHHDNYVIFLPEFSLNTNPKWPVIVAFSDLSGVYREPVNIWCFFRAKPPFSYFSGVVWASLIWARLKFLLVRKTAIIFLTLWALSRSLWFAESEDNKRIQVSARFAFLVKGSSY